MHTAILLATYNSGRYLREQLDSLYKQTYREWVLYIHDDGSNDDTLEIIGEYAEKYGNIEILAPEIKHLGPKKNFMYLLNHVAADYYLFCDHDDVWFPNKVEITVNKIIEAENRDPEKGVVFHSDLTVVDGALNIKDSSLWHYAKIFPNLMHSRNYVLTSCFITGCTLGLNNKAKMLIPNIPDDVIMHDWWIGVQAVMQNMVLISYPKPLIYYRLHGNNEAGIPQGSLLKYLKRNLSSFLVSDYDKKVRIYVRIYHVKNYSLYKSLLLIRKFLYPFIYRPKS